MGSAAATSRLGQMVRGLRRTPEAATAAPFVEPRLTCVASVRIPEANVVDALRAVGDAVSPLRSYATKSDAVSRARINLVHALKSADQGADRTLCDYGVRVHEARGSSAEIEAIYSALAPFVTANSFVQGPARYWTFEENELVAHEGVHPDARRITSRDCPSDFGGA